MGAAMAQGVRNRDDKILLTVTAQYVRDRVMTQDITIPIVAKLGGKARVRAILAEAGYGSPPGAVNNWLARGRVSGKAQLLLMERAADLGIAVAPGDFRSQPACDGTGGHGKGRKDSSDAG